MIENYTQKLIANRSAPLPAAPTGNNLPHTLRAEPYDIGNLSKPKTAHDTEIHHLLVAPANRIFNAH